MCFVEVEDVNEYWKELADKNLPQHFPGARLSEIKKFSWGRECFLHDPSGVLWHFGEFHKEQRKIG